MTVNAETRAKLHRAQDLLRHSIPDGDPAAIFDRALTLLLEHLEQTKHATLKRGGRPRQSPRAPEPGCEPKSDRQCKLVPEPVVLPHDSTTTTTRSRHIPAAVKREVWARDEGQCAFVAADGTRCTERGFLEYHHRVPWAVGGVATAGNVSLRCTAHNAHEAASCFQRRAGPEG